MFFKFVVLKVSGSVLGICRGLVIKIRTSVARFSTQTLLKLGRTQNWFFGEPKEPPKQTILVTT